MRKKKKRKMNGERMMEALISLAHDLDSDMSPLIRPWAHLRYGDATSIVLGERERKLQYEAYCRLKKKRLIRQRKRAKMLILELTEEGKNALLKQRIIDCEKTLQNGTLCYVSFDFPERERRARNAFRDLLQQADFRMRHQSLWQTRMDIILELSELVKRLHIKDWVEVIRAKKI